MAYHVSRKIVYDAPVERVFPYFGDVTKFKEFHPRLKGLDLISEEATGLGAARVCTFKDDTSVKETVTEFAANERVHLVLTEFSAPMKVLEVTFAFESLPAEGDGEARAAVTMHMRYTPKGGCVGALMNKLMIRKNMGKVEEMILGALAEYMRTGEMVAGDYKGPVLPEE
mmetsp:Transcript_8513/g.30273  ORF Transcript_8513/g.30273 Transcript_8513/m.30273 type:complete len:170 (-) Transcript_8513:286-795(-)